MKKNFIFVLIFVIYNNFFFAQNINEPESITILDIDKYFTEYSQSYVTGIKENSYIVWNWASKEGLRIYKKNINSERSGFQFFNINNEKKQSFVVQLFYLYYLHLLGVLLNMNIVHP